MSPMMTPEEEARIRELPRLIEDEKDPEKVSAACSRAGTPFGRLLTEAAQ
jgi:hypothetical protein